MERKTLIEVFPDWVSGGGIFSVLQGFDVPWKNDNISVSLDIEYYGSISGEKYISPLIEKIKSAEVLTTDEKGILATSLMAIYGRNWGKLWDTMEFDYNPIENYSMTEIMEDDETVTEYGRTHTRTDNLSHGKTGTETDAPNTTETRTDNLTHRKTGTETETPNITETRTDNLATGESASETVTPNTTETTTPNLTNNVNNSVYGFNSSTAVNTGASATTETGNTITTKTGTESKSGSKSVTNTGTQTLAKTGENETEYNTTENDTGTQRVEKTGTEQRTYNTQETDTGTVNDSDGGQDTHTRNYTLTRSGNIGVTTSQQMIESERKLWIWNFFHDVVFPDIDRALTLSIY